MKVLKFGGTSVGSVNSLKNVKKIVEQQAEQIVVVVSALNGVTDQLIAMTRKAEARDASYELMLKQLYDRHMAAVDEVVPSSRQKQCRGIMDQFFKIGLPQFYAMLYANGQQLDRSNIASIEDAIVSHGEILSSAIVSCMIDDAVPHFSPNFIKTKDVDGERILDNSTFKRVVKEFKGRKEAVHITQGFISEDSDNGAKTNLGRGGSDFTAAIIAAALDAGSLEIWTDVDGFYTADPRTHPDAHLIEKMTYAQAVDMCEAGAKVIYAPTLSPVALKHIPVWVKNTFNPQARGTLITD